MNAFVAGNRIIVVGPAGELARFRAAAVLPGDAMGLAERDVTLGPQIAEPDQALLLAFRHRGLRDAWRAIRPRPAARRASRRHCGACTVPGSGRRGGSQEPGSRSAGTACASGNWSDWGAMTRSMPGLLAVHRSWWPEHSPRPPRAVLGQPVTWQTAPPNTGSAGSKASSSARNSGRTAAISFSSRPAGSRYWPARQRPGRSPAVLLLLEDGRGDWARLPRRRGHRGHAGKQASRPQTGSR